MSENLYVSGTAILTAIGRAGDAAALAELKESAGLLPFDTGIIERDNDVFLPQKTIEELCYEVQTPFAGVAYDAFAQIQAALAPLPAEQAAEAPRSRRRAPATAADAKTDPVAQALAGLPEPAPSTAAPSGSTPEAAPSGSTPEAAPSGSTPEAATQSGRGRGGRGRAASGQAAAAATTPAASAPAPEPQTAGQARIQELRMQADTSVSDGEPLEAARVYARVKLAMLRAQIVVLEEILK